jgi:hypothetical protein
MKQVNNGTTDGYKFFFKDGSTVLFRPSGTEPLFRIYVEAVHGNPDEAGRQEWAHQRAQLLVTDLYSTILSELGLTREQFGVKVVECPDLMTATQKSLNYRNL